MPAQMQIQVRAQVPLQVPLQVQVQVQVHPDSLAVPALTLRPQPASLPLNPFPRLRSRPPAHRDTTTSCLFLVIKNRGCCLA